MTGHMRGDARKRVAAAAFAPLQFRQAEVEALLVEARAEALREAADWLARTGYPVQFTMPDLPPPASLFAALVDVVHADKTGEWHGNELTRDEVEFWLQDEAGLNDRADRIAGGTS